MDEDSENTAVLDYAQDTLAIQNITSRGVLNPSTEYPLGHGARSSINTISGKVRFDSLPVYPDLDMNPPPATSINNPTVDYSTLGLGEDHGRDQRGALFAAYVYESNTPSHGLRIPRETNLVPSFDYTYEDTDVRDLDEVHYYNGLSAAPYGTHSVDSGVRAVNELPRRNIGNIGRGRNAGTDRLDNPSIFTSPAVGLPYNKIIAVPQGDAIRINGNQTAPIMSVPRAF
jgi:hypothetical protein